jgi:hypothetical protein
MVKEASIIKKKLCSETCVLLPVLLDTRDVNSDNLPTVQEERSHFWYIFFGIDIYLFFSLYTFF